MKVHVCDNGKFTITLIKTEKVYKDIKLLTCEKTWQNFLPGPRNVTRNDGEIWYVTQVSGERTVGSMGTIRIQCVIFYFSFLSQGFLCS